MSPSSPAPLVEIVALEPAQRDFARRLIHDNMRPYYEHYRCAWKPDVFERSLAESENFAIKRNGFLAGVLRLVDNPDDLHVSDLHIVSELRSLGLGRAGLEFAIALAGARRKRFVRLTVLDINPAQHLYRRLGFVEVRQAKHLLWLERVLG